MAFKNKRDKRFMKKFTNIFETLEKHFANVQQVYALSLLVFETSGFCIFNTSCVSFCHKDFELKSLLSFFFSPQPPLCLLVVEHNHDHLSHTILAHAEAWANVHSSGPISNIFKVCLARILNSIPSKVPNNVNVHASVSLSRDAIFHFDTY